MKRFILALCGALIFHAAAIAAPAVSSAPPRWHVTTFCASGCNSSGSSYTPVTGMLWVSGVAGGGGGAAGNATGGAGGGGGQNAAGAAGSGGIVIIREFY